MILLLALGCTDVEATPDPQATPEERLDALAPGASPSLSKTVALYTRDLDTVADVLTVLRAREQQPERRLLALAVLPPHRQAEGLAGPYAQNLRAAGADLVLLQTTDLKPALLSRQLHP